MTIRDFLFSGQDDGQAIEPVPEIGIDELLSVLANRRRRLVIRELSDRVESVQLGDLAEQIAAREYNCDVADVESVQRKRVYVSLYQTHLELMEEVGLLQYDGAYVDSTAGTEFARAVLDDIDARMGGQG